MLSLSKIGFDGIKILALGLKAAFFWRARQCVGKSAMPNGVGYITFTKEVMFSALLVGWFVLIITKETTGWSVMKLGGRMVNGAIK